MAQTYEAVSVFIKLRKQIFSGFWSFPAHFLKCKRGKYPVFMSFIPPNIQFPSFRKSLPLPLSGATVLPSNFTFRLSLSIHWDIWALTGPHSVHNNTSRLQHGKQRPEDQVRTLQFTCTLHSVYTIRGTLCALSHPL